MSKSGLRNYLIGGAAAGAIAAAIAAPAWAQEATYDFNQPSMEMAAAIQAVGHQTGANILVDSRLVSGLRSPELRGALSTDQALIALLDGTGLTAQRTDKNSILIRRASDPQSGSAAGDGADGTVQALIVTAQKREEDIQDVPIAISAFTQEDLTRSQVAGGPDLVTQVPNFTFTKTNFSSYSIQIRGIGTQAISATTDPAVAVAFNNTPFIRNRFFEQEFYDLERVEVLRGPQGTLYGRNATAGVVNIISAKPKFRYEARLSADLGNFSSSRIEGMVNIPLIEDRVALRLAAAWTKRDGYATNQITDNPIDGRDLWSTRLSLRVQPTDRLNANLIWEHFEEKDDRLRSGKQLCKKDVVTHVGDIQTPDFNQTLPDQGQSGILSGVQATFSQGCTRESLYDPSSFQTPNGLMLPYYLPLGSIGLAVARTDPYVSTVQSPDLRIIESTVDPKYRASNDLGELQISYDLTDNLTLASETAYATDFVYSLQDFNRFNTASGAWTQPRSYDRPGVLQIGPNGGIFCDPQLGCSDRLVAVDIATATARQFSQEFRLSSNFQGKFNFSLGGNFLRADSEDKYYVFFNSTSLFAASGAAFSGLDPYVPGVTDNTDCMENGYAQGDPNGVYPVTGCTYLDPNPIDKVNDQGHNYFLSKNPYKLISYAVFGEAYYQLADNLKLTAGLRWTVDKKEAPRIPTWILSSFSVGYPVADVIEQEWREPTGRLTLDWKPDLSFTDETLLYASFAHGYKAGGANPPGYVRVFYANSELAQANADASATRPRTFEPEFVNAFEVGAKNTLLEGRLTANLTGFYYDYTGYQVSEIVDRSAFNRNFDATVWGLEFESDWRPLENLRLGLKTGYERTRIADGEQAVDLTDRTAGNPDWVVVKPFPTYASNCVLPVYVFSYSGSLINPGGVSGGNPSACELAYVMGVDPVTRQDYVADPFPGYQGFNPLDASQGHNFGEGFFKQLGGNELPNAPHFTATVTGDYTVPLPSEWLMTLHTDVHWQSQSWWRVFNDHVYDKLHPYFTMNLAAIFTNEEAGWNIMAYVKNVTDETAITGAFLNSDDTGLTTNVFLTEPRLYGLRVTKAWTGSTTGWITPHEGPSPFTVEVGGQIQRHDAPNQVQAADAAAIFDGPLAIFGPAQTEDLDWGDGREVKLTWRPSASRWSVSAGVRFGETNTVSKPHVQLLTPETCAFGGALQGVCAKYNDPIYAPFTNFTEIYGADAEIYRREEHTLVDFMVGHDVGIGGLSRSTVGVGLRYARLKSTTQGELRGIPEWYMPDGFFYPGYMVKHTVYNIDIDARREFEGAGPQLSWDAAFPVFDQDAVGRVDVEWSVDGGVLFGKQSASSVTNEKTRYFDQTAFETLLARYLSVQPKPDVITQLPPTTYARSKTVTAPNLGGSLGLSYTAGGFKASAGYRWERYFNAIDGGYDEHKSFDRTIDGPYFRISVGFGG